MLKNIHKLKIKETTKNTAKFGGTFYIKCYDKDGNLKWEDTAKNLVTTEGLNHILDIMFVSATAQIDPWYVGISNGSPTPAAADTLASHAGWVENSNYTGNRQTFVDVRTNQQVDNSASKASFAINTNTQTLGGAFLASVATGTAGTLLCIATFTGGNKSADSGDTLEVEYQYTAADDGA